MNHPSKNLIDGTASPVGRQPVGVATRTADDSEVDAVPGASPRAAGGVVPVRSRRRSAGTREPLSPIWHKVIGLASVVAGLALWQLLASTGVINRQLSSSPVDIFHSLRTMISNGSLLKAIAASAKLYAVGLGLSLAIGIVCGLAFGWWRTLGAVFDPWIAVLYSTPLLAMLPLIIVWFGIGFRGQVVMVVLVSVFPLLVNVMGGTRQVDENLLRMARSFGASQPHILRTLVLPSLVPYIVTGVRLAVGTALIGVVIGEYFEGTEGIGNVILKAGVMLDTSGVFVGVLVLACAALVMTGLVGLLERRFSSWREV